MRKFLKFFNRTIIHFGLDVKRFFRSLRGLPVFLSDIQKYKKLSSSSSMPLRVKNIFPILFDKYDTAGDARGHYFAQDIWASRKIFSAKPERHVDIGSSVRGFVSSLLAFMDRVEVVDVRPLKSSMNGLVFIQDDATKLEGFGNGSLKSISTLHAAEHFGLGRYGDPIDPDAPLKFANSLKRVLAPGGYLYFSVPVGKERVEFNAQRVFAPSTIIKMFDGLELVSFSGVKDDGDFYPNIRPEDLANEYFGCGMFEFRK